MTITSVSKPILFDHVKGKIYGSNELVAYKKENREWVKTNEKFYRFQNLKVVPNAWGLNSYSAGDCVTYQNRYFMCIRSNNGNDTPVIFNDDSVNKAFWHEYTYLFNNITSAAVLGEYEDYYNYCLYSEDLSKGVSKSDIESKTTGRKKLSGKELDDYLQGLKNTPWLYNNVTVTSSTVPLKNENSWIIKAGVQSVVTEHCISQEITAINPNDIFCLTAYVKQKEIFSVGMGIEIQADSGIVNYIAMFNLIDGNPISIKFYDAKYNELVEDPEVIDNLSSKMELVYEEDNTYRIALMGKVKNTAYQPKIKIKFFIPSDSLEIKYITDRELSLYLNNIQINTQSDYLYGDESPYMYLPTSLKTIKAEQLNKQYYRMLNGNIVPFEGKFVILDKLPNASPYEAGDYCFLYAPVYFVDGLKMGELEEDTENDDEKPLVYYKPDSDEYHLISRNKQYRFLTSVENKWKSKLFNAFVFNKYGYYRNAGQQFRIKR